MADQPQAKEWQPRSHKVGSRHGTLTRAAAGKAKIFEQLIAEEAEDVALQQKRDHVGTAFVEVAFISCKDEADGVRYVQIMKNLETRGAKGEAFFQLFELYPGTGVTFSKFMLISVGSPETFIKLHEDRSEEEVAELTRVVKKYHSTVYTAKASGAMKDLIAKLNATEQKDKSIFAVQGHTYTSKIYQVEVAESPAYAFESGMGLVQRYLTHIKQTNLTVRVERITTTDAAAMGAVEKAYEATFSAPHRVNTKQPWRPQIREAIGQQFLPNTPLAFVQKVDDTHVEVVIFDDEATFKGDGAFAAGSEEVKASIAGLESVDVFEYGKTKCENHIFASAGSKFSVYPAMAKLDNPLSDLLGKMHL